MIRVNYVRAFASHKNINKFPPFPLHPPVAIICFFLTFQLLRDDLKYKYINKTFDFESFDFQETMKVILFSIFCVFVAFTAATDDQVTELPTAIALDAAGLVSNGGHSSIRRDAVPKAQSSSSESSEEKSIDAAVVLTTGVTPIGVISDSGVPVVQSARKRRTVTETQAETNVGSSDYPVTEPPKSAVTPQGVEEDDGLPDLGLGTRRKRGDVFREPVTEPPKGAVTPEGVESDDGLPEVGLGSRKKRGDEFREPVTEPPKSAVTPQGVEEDDGLPDLGLGTRRKRGGSDYVGDASYGVTEPPQDSVTPKGVEEESWLPDLGIGSRRRREGK